MRGVSLDALNPYGRPDKGPLATLFRATGHRLVAFDDIMFYWYVHQLELFGYEYMLVLTKDSFSQEQSYYDNAVRWARSMPKSTNWIIGNEWNADGDASWPPTNQYRAIYSSIAAGLRAVDPTAVIYIGGMFSQPNLVELLISTINNLSTPPNGVSLHLYLNNMEETEQILMDLQPSGLDLCMGEWNWMDGTKQNFVDYQALLNKYTKHSFYFCWSDGMVDTYGLKYTNNRKKPVFKHYSEALRLA